ncbi:hypothetical protein [Zavarzinella formosa]|uniref:hypothetical protein n=1 Tax=Zavarzinella formosa TaxID=360055 RepID=UPI00030B07A6|nr:hypothetical protein [Zavarzinella formosa]
MPDLSDEIADAAANPASAEADGVKAQAQPIPDLIEADRYLAGKTALNGANPKGGQRSGFNALRRGVFVPRGTV